MNRRDVLSAAITAILSPTIPAPLSLNGVPIVFDNPCLANRTKQQIAGFYLVNPEIYARFLRAPDFDGPA